jgi:hypothetical protein
MDSNRLAWLEKQTYERVCHAWMNFIWRAYGIKPSEATYGDPGVREYRNAQASVISHRSRGKPFNPYSSRTVLPNRSRLGLGPGYFKNRVNLVEHRIINTAKSFYGKDRPRTSFEIEVGKEKKGEKGKSRGQLSLTLGYMWERRVKPLYDKGFKNDDWMILDCVQFKVNARHIRLYECFGYNPRVDENKVVYVAEKTIGTHKFVFGHSMKAVLSDIETAVANEVHKEMIGENNG